MNTEQTTIETDSGLRLRCSSGKEYEAAAKTRFFRQAAMRTSVLRTTEGSTIETQILRNHFATVDNLILLCSLLAHGTV